MAWIFIAGRLFPGSPRVSFALGRDIANAVDKLGEDGLTALMVARSCQQEGNLLGVFHGP